MNISKRQLFKTLCEYKIPHTPSRLRIVKETEDFIQYENGEKYHKFNRLNDLTNKSWLKFQKSWFILNPKPREDNVLLHPAKFPEELIEEHIKFFTKKGETVLDPMLGTGSTLVACVKTGRNGVGVELLKKYAYIAKQRLAIVSSHIPKGEKDFYISVKVLLGDARNLELLNLANIDYCITSPPYWDMLSEEGFETQKSRRERNLDLYYSRNPLDLGNIKDYCEFLNELTSIFFKVYNIIKPGGYLTVIVKNIKKKGRVYPLAWDLGKSLNEFFRLKDERIWCQDNIRLAPYGYGRAWVSNTVHHYCLNFRKEN